MTVGGPLLTVRDVSLAFGGLLALDAVDLAVWPGEIRGLIGPNGAGKTSLFNVIAGVSPPRHGRVLFRGLEITGWAPHRIAEVGLTRTHQNLKLFDEMTVLENVAVAAQIRRGLGVWASLLRTPGGLLLERALLTQARDLLAYVGLPDVPHVRARELPYGQKKVLELARALATTPSLILLDEPTAGMNTEETDGVMAVIGKMRDAGQTLVVIEHDMRMVMGISDRVTVLHFGRVIADGPPTAVQRDPAVIEAYLGSRARAARAPEARPPA